MNRQRVPMLQSDFCPECGTRFDPADTACRKCGVSRPDAATVGMEEAPAPADTVALDALTDELRDALAPTLQLLKPLGQGGMGTVFLARDPALKRLVVVKVLSPDLAYEESARRRFEREAESAAAVAHPNVVGVFQVGRLPRSGTSYFVMQYVNGQTLSDTFPVGAVVPVARARRIVAEVAAALSAAHARGVVHRDIKPVNVMLERESERVVVLDFGISAAIGPERRASVGTKLTQMGSSIGTPQYMSPEQAAADEVTDKSDVYSLGVVAYELLTGRPPFEEKTPMALAAAHINKTPAPVATLRPDVDAPFAQLVDRCLAKEPASRPSAAQVVRALGTATGPVIEWPPPGLDGLHRLGARFAAALTVTVAVALLFFWLLFDPPTVGSPRWSAGELSNLWFSVGGGCCEARQISGPFPRRDPTPAWQFALALLVVAEAALAAFALAQAYRVRSLIGRARRSGYPLAVCLDVAFDRHRDTGSLINGAAAFASLEEPVRARLRRWRRQRAALIALAPVVTIILAIGWLLLASGASERAERIVSAPAFALLLLPMVGALAGYAVLAAREGSAVPRTRLTWRQWLARRRQPLVARELAVNWLRGGGGAEIETGAHRGLLLGGHALLWVLLALFLAVMVLTTYVSVRSSAMVAQYRKAAGTWQDVRGRWRATTWKTLDSAVRSLAPLPTASRPDSEAAASLLGLLIGVDTLGGDEARLWHVPRGTAAASLPGYAGANLPGILEFLRQMRQRADTLPVRLRRAIDVNLASSGFAAWQRFARAAPPPALWFLAPDFGGLDVLSALRIIGHSAGPVYDLTKTSLMAVAVAAKRGDRSRALAATGELLAAGLTLAREPVPSLRSSGLRAIADGTSALRALARRWADAELLARVDRVSRLLGRVPGWGEEATSPYGSRNLVEPVESGDWEAIGFALGPILLVSDPSSESADQALAGMIPASASSTTTLAEPVDHWRLIGAVVPAFCTSPREVLLGIDRARGAALEAALGRQRDLPRTDEWIRMNLRWYQQWRDHPSAAGVPPKGQRPDVPLAIRPLGWIGLRAMRDRIAFCDRFVWK